VVCVSGFRFADFMQNVGGSRERRQALILRLSQFSPILSDSSSVNAWHHKDADRRLYLVLAIMVGSRRNGKIIGCGRARLLSLPQGQASTDGFAGKRLVHPNESCSSACPNNVCSIR